MSIGEEYSKKILSLREQFEQLLQGTHTEEAVLRIIAQLLFYGSTVPDAVEDMFPVLREHMKRCLWTYPQGISLLPSSHKLVYQVYTAMLQEIQSNWETPMDGDSEQAINHKQAVLVLDCICDRMIRTGA